MDIKSRLIVQCFKDVTPLSCVHCFRWKEGGICIAVPFYVNCHFWLLSRYFSFSLIFSRFTVMSWCVCFPILVLWNHWASQICTFMSCTKFGKVLVIVDFKVLFLYHSLLFSRIQLHILDLFILPSYHWGSVTFFQSFLCVFIKFDLSYWFIFKFTDFVFCHLQPQVEPKKCKVTGTWEMICVALTVYFSLLIYMCIYVYIF